MPSNKSWIFVSVFGVPRLAVPTAFPSLPDKPAAAPKRNASSSTHRPKGAVGLREVFIRFRVDKRRGMEKIKKYVAPDLDLADPLKIEGQMRLSHRYWAKPRAEARRRKKNEKNE